VVVAIPDYNALISQVETLSPRPNSRVHGTRHWKHVALIGHRLVKVMPAADPLVVLLFALFHDAGRQNEWGDPQHGARGAALARHLHGSLFSLTLAQLALLTTACEGHTAGRLAEDPTIGTCRDADRLNLWRIGRSPDARYLSTAEARTPETIAWARNLLHLDPTSDAVVQQYSPLLKPSFHQR